MWDTLTLSIFFGFLVVLCVVTGWLIDRTSRTISKVNDKKERSAGDYAAVIALISLSSAAAVFTVAVIVLAAILIYIGESPSLSDVDPSP